MLTVDQIAAEIVSREGGYVDDPDDPGGATNHGVTLATLRRLGLDKTGDGRVDAADVKALDRNDAARIFTEHYYRRPRLSDLPAALQPSVFDMYVNAGTHAVKLLQRLVTRMGFAATDDGQVGPLTIRATREAALAAPRHIADAYGIARRNYYYALGDSRPSSRKYCRRKDGGKGGWITRAEGFIDPRFHLSDAQHQARVSTWA